MQEESYGALRGYANLGAEYLQTVDKITQVDISKAQKIDGWMFNCELEWLAIQASQHYRIVEVGSYLGRSTRALGDHAQGVVYAVDPWSRDDYKSVDGTVGIGLDAYEKFIHNLSDLIISRRVIPVKSYFSEARLPDNVDMIFLDGDHSYDEVKNDINQAREMLMPNGLLCGHDYINELRGVKQAVNDLIGEKNIYLVGTIWVAKNLV